MLHFTLLQFCSIWDHLIPLISLQVHFHKLCRCKKPAWSWVFVCSYFLTLLILLSAYYAWPVPSHFRRLHELATWKRTVFYFIRHFLIFEHIVTSPLPQLKATLPINIHHYFSAFSSGWSGSPAAPPWTTILTTDQQQQQAPPLGQVASLLAFPRKSCMNIVKKKTLQNTWVINYLLLAICFAKGNSHFVNY